MVVPFYGNITSDVEYTFFPRAELAGLYRECPDSFASAKPYYENLDRCRFVGSRNPSGNSNYTISLDAYPPENRNEPLSLMHDCGDVIYDEEAGLAPCRFLCIAGKYRNIDLISRELLMESDPGENSCVLGCALAVYMLPNKKIRRVLRASDGGPVVIPTRDGIGFLKEFYVFQAYVPPEIYQTPDSNVRFWIKCGGRVVAEWGD